MDMAAPAFAGKGWETAQTSNMGGGLPDSGLLASPIATVNAQFKKAFLTQVSPSVSPNPCTVQELGGRVMYQKLSIAVNKNIHYCYHYKRFCIKYFYKTSANVIFCLSAGTNTS